ncbi:nucleotide sugar dehydrogenase [Pseudomonadota bacterium]
MKQGNNKIAIIGLGYVGLPLAVEFAKQYPTTGFDIKQSRIDELKIGKDSTLEVDSEELLKLENLSFTSNPEDISDSNIYIVTVPTPIDEFKRPDLSPLHDACRTIGEVLKHGDIVIFESTVFPGATEEVCMPILESVSGLKFNRDFFLGYSPERINPGDKQHRITDIEKLTSGSTPITAERVDQLYASIITAGTHKVSSIRVAEAAKVIENTQRDINIALINELAKLFDHLDLDTEEVLKAAGTKWNFLNFRPGLVGGHCIGVDPYYLTHRATQAGYHPEIILAGRRINDSMAEHVADKLVRKMSERGISIVGANILVMGVTFKENCPDTRNSQIFRTIAQLERMNAKVDATDPWVDPDEAAELGLVLTTVKQKYDAIMIAVAHREFSEMGIKQIRQLGKDNCVIFDLKYLFDQQLTDVRL